MVRAAFGATSSGPSKHAESAVHGGFGTMSDAERDGPGTGPTPAEAIDLETRRRALGTGLTDAQKRHAPPAASERPGNAFGIAMRLAVELVSALAVGGAIGWGVDWLVDTKPLFFLLFLGLGTAAGIMNVFRSARRMNEAPESPGRASAGRSSRDKI